MKLAALSLVALVACNSDVVDPPDDDRGAPGKADSVQWGSCAADDGQACGGRSEGTCYCDDECATFHDCCEDAGPACGVESNRLENRIAGQTPRVGAGELQVAASLPYPPGDVGIS